MAFEVVTITSLTLIYTYTISCTTQFQGLAFEVVPSQFDEKSLDKAAFESVAAFVMESAKSKAAEVRERESAPFDVIIGSDTVISYEGSILEKPTSEDDAVHMLGKLSGARHSVLTGVALLYKDKDGKEGSRVWFTETYVEFAELSLDVIKAYVASGEPMDKAGSYGIQGRGGALVKRIEGDYYTVVGLPLNSLSEALVALCNGPWT